MNGGAWWVAKNWTRLHFHFWLSCFGEGNGNPLQCSCLENPRDGGAWWAAVYGVTQSQTGLKRLSSSSSKMREISLIIHFFFFNIGSCTRWSHIPCAAGPLMGWGQRCREVVGNEENEGRRRKDSWGEGAWGGTVSAEGRNKRKWEEKNLYT